MRLKDRHEQLKHHHAYESVRNFRTAQYFPEYPAIIPVTPVTTTVNNRTLTAVLDCTTLYESEGDDPFLFRSLSAFRLIPLQSRGARILHSSVFRIYEQNPFENSFVMNFKT